MDLPPGFRFHPTNEELITHYLSRKVVDKTFVCKAIGEVDMNRIEPWELPRMAKMGEKEWYFFCVRDKKYPTGSRTNRATAAGYWKATGKDKEIFRRKLLVGMKKTLVFYMGRAPKGEKTNWIIHEFRLEGKSSLQNTPKSTKNEWVISRLFHKNSGGKKVNNSELTMADSGGVASSLPPLMDSPAAFSGKMINSGIPESLHVPCFSNPINTQTIHKTLINNFLNNQSFSSNFNSNPLPDPPVHGNHQFHSGSTIPGHDYVILKGLIENYDQEPKIEGEIVTGSQDTGSSSEMNTKISSNFEMGKRGIEDQEAPSTSIGGVDLDLLWNY